MCGVFSLFLLTHAVPRQFVQIDLLVSCVEPQPPFLLSRPGVTCIAAAAVVGDVVVLVLAGNEIDVVHYICSDE